DQRGCPGGGGGVGLHDRPALSPGCQWCLLRNLRDRGIPRDGPRPSDSSSDQDHRRKISRSTRNINTGRGWTDETPETVVSGGSVRAPPDTGTGPYRSAAGPAQLTGDQVGEGEAAAQREPAVVAAARGGQGGDRTSGVQPRDRPARLVEHVAVPVGVHP